MITHVGLTTHNDKDNGNIQTSPLPSLAQR